jgi:hypothetical protein
LKQFSKPNQTIYSCKLSRDLGSTSKIPVADWIVEPAQELDGQAFLFEPIQRPLLEEAGGASF